MASTTKVITKKINNTIYYWNEDDCMLMKQVLPTRGMRIVAEVSDPSKLDEFIMKDVNGG